MSLYYKLSNFWLQIKPWISLNCILNDLLYIMLILTTTVWVHKLVRKVMDVNEHEHE